MELRFEVNETTYELSSRSLLLAAHVDPDALAHISPMLAAHVDSKIIFANMIHYHC